MKRTWFLIVLAGALLSLNAKCSDCDKAKATALATCQAQGQDSQACKDAEAEVAKACAQPTPPPTTCPEQCPAGQVCVDPALGCQPEVAPGPVCTAGQYCDCWHNPTGDKWLKAECAAGQVCNDAKQCVVAPPTTCEPPCAVNEKCVEHGSVEHTYTCEPIPGPTAPPLIPDEELTGVPDAGGVQMWAETDAAIKRHQKLYPEKWVAKSGGTCLVAGVSGIDDAFLGIATELARQSIVAGQSVSKSGQKSDALFVNRTGTDLYEEMHLFDYSRACVATGPNAYKGLYKRTSNPTPPPTYGCTDPLPDLTASNQQFNCRPFSRYVDCTPITKNDTKYQKYNGMFYCNAIGAEETRHSCPARFDCPSFKCEERVACETYFVKGKTVVDSRNGAVCLPKEGNQMEFWPNNGNCRLCNADKTVCGGWF